VFLLVKKGVNHYEKAAKLSGIKTERLTFGTFVTMGALAALAGLIFSARLNTATPKAGVGFELDVIAAVFIGGASASGGVGKVMGAVIGAFIMGVMNNGMSIMGVGIDWQQVVKGLVLWFECVARLCQLRVGRACCWGMGDEELDNDAVGVHIITRACINMH